MLKKKICLITNWYPTDDNPYQGLFFREQAIALAEFYDFIVIHYYFSSKGIGKTELKKGKREYNITEYTAIIRSITMNRIIRNICKKVDVYNDCLFVKICKLIRNEKIDVFYTISGQNEAALTAKFASFFDRPYVVSEHGPFPWIGTLLSEDNKRAIEKANLFLAISNDKVRQILMQGIKLPKIIYIGNMVDEEKFVFNHSENKNVKTFITVGANVFYKNYAMLIETFNRLREITDKPFKVIVVGYQANKGYSRNAEKLVDAFKKGKFWKDTEMIPNVNHDDMPSLYARADAFVMTSIQEGQPVSAIEAGCCGLPIFSTRCGGVEDYVDESIGVIVDLLDSVGLAESLRKYLEGYLEFDTVHIRNYILKKFGKKAYIKKMKDAFDSVVDTF